MLLDAKKYAQKLTVTEEEVELLYEERKESLIEPEERYLNQILVSEEVKANKIYKILANKKIFLKLQKLRPIYLQKILILVGTLRVNYLKKLLRQFSI